MGTCGDGGGEVKKYTGLLIVLICIVILSGCNKPKDEKKETKGNTDILSDSGASNNLKINLDTEKGIRDYLAGDWVFDKIHISNVVCNMSIDKDLMVNLSFHDTYANELKGDYKGQIKFDRQYANLDEAPDLLIIELMDTDYPGGDFFFLHRTIYDGKVAMSWFFAGNGNCIFDMLADIDNFEYAPGEIIFEKVGGEESQLPLRKNETFHGVFWGKEAKGEGLWIDDVQWMGQDEFDTDGLYPVQMTLYKNDVKESVLYQIARNNNLEISENDLFPGEVYYVETDIDGNIVEFIHEEYDDMNESENFGFTLFENSDMGRKEIVKAKNEIELVKESGPFTVKISEIQMLNFNLFDEYKEIFDGKDQLSIITMSIEVEHHSAGSNSIFPLLGRVLTNTKEEVEVNYMWSDGVGGEYISEVVERGNILFVLDSKTQDINKISYIIDGAEDENYNLIGEEIEFEIEF